MARVPASIARTAWFLQCACGNLGLLTGARLAPLMQNYKETPFDLMVIDAFIAAKSLTITDKARVIIGRYMQAHVADENNPRIPKLAARLQAINAAAALEEDEDDE